jgi:hypothetical protein
MSTTEISLEGLRRLVSTIDSGYLNLFLGAGISRDAPTHGPIWSEMQVKFLHAKKGQICLWLISAHHDIE